MVRTGRIEKRRPRLKASTPARPIALGARRCPTRVGAGLEYAITQNLVFGVEYNYISLSEDVSADLFRSGAFLRTIHSDVDTDIHSVMARLSLKFGRDEPMARPMK